MSRLSASMSWPASASATFCSPSTARTASPFLTTHDLADIERLCSRVLLIDRGRLLYDGSVEQLKARYAPYRVVTIECVSATALSTDGWLDGLSGVTLLRRERPRAWLRVEPVAIVLPDLVGALAARLPLVDLTIGEPALEAVVRQIYEERERCW